MCFAGRLFVTPRLPQPKMARSRKRHTVTLLTANIRGRNQFGSSRRFFQLSIDITEEHDNGPMQGEHDVTYSPNSHSQRRHSHNRTRLVTAAALFVSLIIGAFVGRRTVDDIHVFVEAEPPTPPKDPAITVLDEFEGMWVLLVSDQVEACSKLFISLETLFRQLGVWIRTPPPRSPRRKRL